MSHTTPPTSILPGRPLPTDLAPQSVEVRPPDTLAASPQHRSASGVAIQCQFCVGQRFRRSRLRVADIKHLLLMRYPVRCLYCSQRQMVSFTVAGVSLPSHVEGFKKQKRRRSRKE